MAKMCDLTAESGANLHDEALSYSFTSSGYSGGVDMGISGVFWLRLIPSAKDIGHEACTLHIGIPAPWLYNQKQLTDAAGHDYVCVQ